MDADQGGGTYSSMDPEALDAARKSLQKTCDGATNDISGLLSDFLARGVPIDNINTITGIANKISPILPELTRRISLGRQLVAQDPRGGKIAYYQGDILTGQFKTVGAAQAQAHIDAQKIQHAKDNDDDVPQSVYDDLSKYGYDPDYSAALVNELGTQGVAFVMSKTGSDGDDPNPNKYAFGVVLSTASYRVKMDHDWYKNVAHSLMYDYGISNPVGTIVNRVAAGGRFSTSAVSALADITFSFSDNDGISANRTRDDYKAMLGILRSDPVTAATYFNQRHDQIYDRFVKHNEVSSLTYGLDDDLAGFVQAATIDAKTDFDIRNGFDPTKPNLAARNASWLINKVGSSGDTDFTGAMQKTFADIGVTYFPDLVTTLKSPLNVTGLKNVPYLGVNASPETWQKFLAQGMKSDAGLAELATVFKNNISELTGFLNSDIEAGHQSGQDTSPQQDPQRATAWTRYARNELQQLFGGALKTADGEIDKDYQDRLNAVNNLVSQGLDLASDPTGALDTLKGLGEDAAKGLLASMITDKIVGEEPALPGTKVTITNTPLDPSGDYATDASSQYNAGLGNGKPPFTPYHDGYGNTFTGDPKTYEKQYGGTFTDGQGHILPQSQIAKNPQALQAYNEWLQDPAVQATVAATDGRPN